FSRDWSSDVCSSDLHRLSVREKLYIFDRLGEGAGGKGAPACPDLRTRQQAGSKMNTTSLRESLPYRACAGMMILNKKRQVFVGRRIDMVSEHWQMPQGGIDLNEDPIVAALRELEEEIGTRNVELVHMLDEWLKYDLPDDLLGKIWQGKYRGQQQKWFLFRFLGRDDEINIQTGHPEFSEWKWADYSDLPRVIVAFKCDLYETVLAQFSQCVL